MSLFPLPLTPFELMMWFDDGPAYPMVFPMVCEFTGEVDRERAQQAFDAVCARHPLLSARVESNRRQRYWVAPADRLNGINWEAPTTIQQRSIDLQHEPGVLVEFHVTPGRAVMTWHFHHCCCDGVSAVAVVAEWLLIYHALVTGTDWQATVQPLEPLALIHRAQLRHGKRQKSAASSVRKFSWRKLWSEAWTALRILRTRPQPLEGPIVATNDRRAEVLVQHLDVATTARLRNVAASRQGNLNDLLLTSLFLTMQRWDLDFRSRRGPSSYRVTMPTNQRIPQDRRLPAANVMSYAMIDRRMDDRTDGDELWATIRRETQAISRYNLSRQFVATLAWGARFPFLMRLFLHRGSCWSSAVLSNVGELARRTRVPARFDADQAIAGNLRLEAAYGVPPIRPGTRVSVGTSLYRDKLTLAVLLDPHYFDADDQQRFLGQLVTHLIRFADG